MVVIRPYDARQDADETFDLWSRSLERTWPLARSDIAAHLRTGLVARRDDRLAAVAFVSRAADEAALQLLLVEPGLQRRGIGKQLHDACCSHLAGKGVVRIGLGGTPGPYLWPGLPVELGAARGAFEAWGWSFGGSAWDLTRSLADYRTPAEVQARDRAGITYRWATPDDRDALAAFEREHFPQWADSFDSHPGAVVAVDGDGAIVGSLLATDGSRPHVWRRLLGDATGSINTVGVAGPAREQGIGTGLVAYACEKLRDRGVDNCHIGWTGLLTFYGRLGFLPWRGYAMASRVV